MKCNHDKKIGEACTGNKEYVGSQVMVSTSGLSCRREQFLVRVCADFVLGYVIGCGLIGANRIGVSITSVIKPLGILDDRESGFIPSSPSVSLCVSHIFSK
jgi:hypothetical protein